MRQSPRSPLMCLLTKWVVRPRRSGPQAQSSRSLLQLRRQIDTLRLSLVIAGNATRRQIDAAPKSGSLTISTLLAYPNAACSGVATAAAATTKFKMHSFALMSAFGPKQTWAPALHMSAFGGKADMTVAEFRFRGRYLGQSGHRLLHCIMSAY